MAGTEGQLEGKAESRCVMICQHQSCERNNAAEVLKAFETANLKAGDGIPPVRIISTGCMGQCSTGPTVRVTPDEIWYYRVKPEDVGAIVEEHLVGDKPVDRLLNPRIHRSFSWG